VRDIHDVYQPLLALGVFIRTGGTCH
jgi:hypothetical protein